MAYFNDVSRGELPALTEELNSNKPEKQKAAVKKVIAAMTIGKDVSSLFPQIVKCMEGSNLDLKKLVYLYIINYAKSQPDLAIMAVNSFRKDARNPTNPLIRALAVRTMGCIRVSRITEYLCEPLKDALQDEDPYVRKTAAICVAKLYDNVPEMVQDDDFMEILTGLLSDGNHMVVANAVAALANISEMKGAPAIPLTIQIVNKVLGAMGECSEWGQVYILDYIVGFTPNSMEEAQQIVDRVVPRLAHTNAAVVISAAKVVLKYMDFITSSENIRRLSQKLAPSLVSLLSGEPQIQYIALKCINLIVQKRGNVLDKEIKVFFCRYNDPIYVKLEKIEIMVKLADQKNIDQVIHELKEYASEVDVEFVRRAVRAIGRCAIKLERAVDRCITCLLDLIHLKVNYVVQEAVIVIRDIFRRYPNRYEMIIKELFANLETLDNPEAKASIVWIIGEYADRIDDATAQLSQFIDSFADETVQVQLALLTATVKLFLKKPEEGETLIMDLLAQVTDNSSNPDLRDRAYIYWRMLSSDPEKAKEIVLGEKPHISEDTASLDPTLLDRLIEDIGKLSSIYHKPAEAICPRRAERVAPEKVETEEPIEFDSTGLKVGSQLGDLIGISMQDEKYATVPLHTVLAKEAKGVNQGSGLSVEMAFQRNKHEQVVLEAKFTNATGSELREWAMQFNTNYYGIALAEPLRLESLPAGSSTKVKCEISLSGGKSEEPPSVPFMVQTAIKCSLDVFYFSTPCMYTVLLVESGKVTKEEFKEIWQNQAPNEFLHTQTVINPAHSSVELVQKRLEGNNVFLVVGRTNEVGEFVGYFSCRDPRNLVVLSEIRIPTPVISVQITCKTQHAHLAPLFIQGLSFLLSTN